MTKNPKAVRITPNAELATRRGEFDEKQLAAAMEWTLGFERKTTMSLMKREPEKNHWTLAPEEFGFEWETLDGKRLVKRFEIAN